MTTQQVADKFYEYMQTGAFDKIYEELYSEDCISNGICSTNRRNAWRKTEQPRVAGNYFTSYMTMDFTPKGGQRMSFGEIGFYEVRDGKIVE